MPRRWSRRKSGNEPPCAWTHAQVEGQELLGSAFAPKQGRLVLLLMVAFGKTRRRGFFFSILSALHLWGEKALWGDGLMGNFLWSDPNTSLMVGERGLCFGSP